MSDTIKVLLVKPDWTPQIIKIESNLTAFQDMVMGYIEMVRISDEYVAIVNEEGHLRKLDLNFQTDIDVIVGNAIICRTKGENFASLKNGDEDKILDLIELL
jgi:hypothetical protein